MLEEKDFSLAIKVLVEYEEAFYPNVTTVGDIKNALVWDEKLKCFSMDYGFALRGVAENIRIYKGVEDYLKNKINPLNQYEGSVVYEGEVYFFECL